MPASLRHTTPTDADELFHIIRASYAEYRGKLDPPTSSEQETVEHLTAVLREARGLLAEMNGQGVGCVFYLEEEDHLYLYRLGVVPACRRQGIGKQLVTAVEEIALSRGRRHVRLAVRLALPQNHRFYTDLGYQVISYERHPGCAQPTYLVMEKQLAFPTDHV